MSKVSFVHLESGGINVAHVVSYSSAYNGDVTITLTTGQETLYGADAAEFLRVVGRESPLSDPQRETTVEMG